MRMDSNVSLISIVQVDISVFFIANQYVWPERFEAEQHPLDCEIKVVFTCENRHFYRSANQYFPDSNEIKNDQTCQKRHYTVTIYLWVSACS